MTSPTSSADRLRTRQAAPYLWRAVVPHGVVPDIPPCRAVATPSRRDIPAGMTGKLTVTARCFLSAHGCIHDHVRLRRLIAGRHRTAGEAVLRTCACGCSRSLMSMPGASKKSSHTAFAGTITRRAPSRKIDTSRTLSGKATSLGRRTACVRLFRNKVVPVMLRPSWDIRRIYSNSLHVRFGKANPTGRQATPAKLDTRPPTSLPAAAVHDAAPRRFAQRRLTCLG